ncbi:MAG TPA: CAP domain-containing protein [Candidatus Eisenbacteria bacterium]|nr:CAP domain-containing protein [Candidatus Eisenbacteria bacterium]
MLKTLAHFFLPRHSNNQRARAIHSQIIFLVVLLLFGSSFLISTSKKNLSGVLGVSVNVSTSDLLNLTNQKRAEAGLSPLQLDGQLSQAAEAKAQNMFAKGYWAHFAPDGTSPWDFIKGAGYPYVYAGENLARGFSSSGDVVNAWMASPDHRANMLSAHYSDVGFAIEQGPLPGDASTVLVVEMFGSKYLAAQQPQAPPVVASVETGNTQQPTPTVAPQITNAPTPTTVPVLAAVKKQPLLDSAFITKATSLFLLSLFLLIFGLDVVVTESRQTVRLAGHSFDHLLFLLGILAIAISIGFGVVG